MYLKYKGGQDDEVVDFLDVGVGNNNRRLENRKGNRSTGYNH